MHRFDNSELDNREFRKQFTPLVPFFPEAMACKGLHTFWRLYCIERDGFSSLKGSKMRFLDTMSLHMAISGLTGFQRTLWMANKHGKRRGLQEVKEHMKKMGQRRDGPVVGDLFSSVSPNPILYRIS